MQSKQEIRLYVKESFRNLSPEEKATLDADVRAKILARVQRESDTAGGPLTLLLYSSLPDEAGTAGLAQELSSLGHSVLLPSVEGDSIVLHEYCGEQSLSKGAFGISESSGPVSDNYTSIDLAFIPGRAFSPDGTRLGRGKGYYDRFLGLLRCPRIGVCLPFQILPSLPSDPHDIPVDEVL